jgi:hypothetical protein
VPEFWRSSGYHLLERTAQGRLALTDNFLCAYFTRPEVAPVEESCDAEIALHEALLADPRMPVPEARLADFADPDARENYETVLGFRDHLLEYDTIEDAYLELFDSEAITVPPLFVDQLTHVILRNILDGCDDPMRIRAAEVLFRSQRLTLVNGAIMLADEETVEMYARTGEFGALGQLLQESEKPARTVELDVLDQRNGAIYWERADKFDTVLDISFTKPGLDALCRVCEGWIGHMLDIKVRIQPMQWIDDEHWSWHIGLDTESTAILNDLYTGEEVDEARLGRMVSLFRLDFADPSVLLPTVSGRSIYLGMAVDEENALHVKPQNLLFNLPLTEQS